MELGIPKSGHSVRRFKATLCEKKVMDFILCNHLIDHALIIASHVPVQKTGKDHPWIFICLDGKIQAPMVHCSNQACASMPHTIEESAHHNVRKSRACQPGHCYDKLLP